MEATVEVLVIARHREQVAQLCQGLARHRIATDVAETLAEALKHFEVRGGHRAVVFGPNVGKGQMAEVLRSLRYIDPQILAVCFGRQRRTLAVSRDTAVHCIPDFHPSSRAGVGAVHRILSGRR